METLDDGFQETVNAIGACNLEERAEDLRGAKRVILSRKGRGIKEVYESANGEKSMGKIQSARTGGRRKRRSGWRVEGCRARSVLIAGRSGKSCTTGRMIAGGNGSNGDAGVARRYRRVGGHLGSKGI